MKVKTTSEQLFFNVVRLDTVYADGSAGSGTGFFFSHVVNGIAQLFLVTNKHVVSGSVSGTFTLTYKNGDEPQLGTGYRLTINDWEKLWHGHPNSEVDITVMPALFIENHIRAETGRDIFYGYIGSDSIPTEEQINNLDAIESVTFVGFPNGLWDELHLLPVARKGTTATPMSVDYEGKPQFLIDASVFGGSSGSPVYIIDNGLYFDRNRGPVMGSRFHFVGVVAESYYRTEYNELVSMPLPTNKKQLAESREMIDLGVVYKSSTVLETVTSWLKQQSSKPTT